MKWPRTPGAATHPVRWARSGARRRGATGRDRDWRVRPNGHQSHDRVAETNLPYDPDRSGTSAVEDGVPGGHVLGVQPSLDLLPGAEVEHTRHSDLDVHPWPPGTHIAKSADVLVVTEHIVLP